MKSNTVLKNKVDSAKTPFLITDIHGIARYANKQVSKKTGFSIAEIIGKKPGDLWGGNMSSEFYQHMWSTIKTKKEPFSATITNTTKSGEDFKQEMFFAPILDKYDSIKYFVEISVGSNIKSEFKYNFDYLFSNQLEHQEKLPDFITKWLIGEDDLEFDQSSKFTDLLDEYLIKPIRTRFKNRKKDKELIQQAKEDPEKFQLLYKKYKEDVYNYFFHRTDQNTAEELTQDTFLKAFRYLDNFTITNASYKTYLMRVAHNLLVNHYRNKDKKSDVNIDNLPQYLFSCLQDYDDPFINQKLKEAIKENLTDTQEKIIKMKYFDQLLVREIATIVQKSENAVKLHLHRGRKRIKKYLRQN
ncbi:MAG: sigma-70 family RNA polymerase sigma factor [Candidatus Magasanikbacteria bacterium]